MFIAKYIMYHKFQTRDWCSTFPIIHGEVKKRDHKKLSRWLQYPISQKCNKHIFSIFQLALIFTPHLWLYQHERHWPTKVCPNSMIGCKKKMIGVSVSRDIYSKYKVKQIRSSKRESMNWEIPRVIILKYILRHAITPSHKSVVSQYLVRINSLGDAFTSNE